MSQVRLILLSVVVLVLWGLSACSGGEVLTATAVPQPTATIPFTWTPTATPLPTETPSPTPTGTTVPTITATATATATGTATLSPTAVPEIVLGDPVIVVSGGFSMQPAEGYEADVIEDAADSALTGLVSMSGEGDTILINVVGVPDAEAYLRGKNDLEALDELVADFVENTNGEYELGETSTILVGEQEATAVAVSGVMFGKGFVGQAVFINPFGSQAFFAIALARDPEIWLNSGQPAFAAMMESVQFLSTAVEDEGDSSGPCVVSTDPAYGTTEANAIQVGGDAFGGPPRERAYLDNLLGPNGETVNYERIGSLPYKDTFLDIYELTYGEMTATLYLDEYNWREPQAPLGFTCAAPFPLTAP